MKKNIVIFGAGNAGKVVFHEIIKLNKFKVIGFVDDNIENSKEVIKFKDKKYFSLGKIESFFVNYKKDIIKKKISGAMGIGLNFTKNKIVKQVSKLSKKFKWEKIISIDSVVNESCEIGQGSVVLSGVTINSGTKIGKFCKINTSSSIDHDNIFNDFSSCGPGVVTGGNVIIGSGSYLGIGSVVKHNINIGENTVVGGNSFVNKDCDDNFLYFGVPIKKIKRRKKNENYL